MTDRAKLKSLWRGAAVAAVLVAVGVGLVALGENAPWWLAGVLAVASGVYARFASIALLAWHFAPELRQYFGETAVDREGDSVKVTTDWRSSGDAELDGYIASYAASFEYVTKTLIWVGIIATVILIMFVASLFGLVEFNW